MLEESKNKSLDGRYKTIFESVNAAAFLTEIDGKILESNQKSCWLSGYKWDDLPKMNISDIFPDSVDWPQLAEEIISKGGMDFESENIPRRTHNRFIHNSTGPAVRGLKWPPGSGLWIYG